MRGAFSRSRGTRIMKYFTKIIDGMIKFMIPLVIGILRTLAVVFSPEKVLELEEVKHGQ